MHDVFSNLVIQMQGLKVALNIEGGRYIIFGPTQSARILSYIGSCSLIKSRFLLIPYCRVSHQCKTLFSTPISK